MVINGIEPTSNNNNGASTNNPSPLRVPFLQFPSDWIHSPSSSLQIGCFHTRIVHRIPNSSRDGVTAVWESRRHRKQLPLKQKFEGSTLSESTKKWSQRNFWWRPSEVPWWTGVLFVIGSICFVFSSIAAFVPSVYNSLYNSTAYAGWTAFTGSIFFTIGSLFGFIEILIANSNIQGNQKDNHKHYKPISQAIDINNNAGEERNQLKMNGHANPEEPQLNSGEEAEAAHDESVTAAIPAGEPVSSPQAGSFSLANPSQSSPTKPNGIDRSASIQSCSASSDGPDPALSSYFGRLDFWISSIQLIGALSFSINTFSFSGSFTLSNDETIGFVDFCDIFASSCFTLVGYLTIVEVSHSIWRPIKPEGLIESLGSLDWWISWNNFLGGAGFLANGITLIWWPLIGQNPNAIPLLIGSIFFLIGSCLQYVEQGEKDEKEEEK